MSEEQVSDRDFVSELGEDVTHAERQLQSQPSQAARRAYTRAVFAVIEGIANHLKLQTLDDAWEPLRSNISNAELAMLREETYSVNSKGEAIAQPRFIRTEDNIAFALRMYMRDYGLEPELDRSGHEWQSFKVAIHVRHRVTHPRRREDLKIADVELEAVRTAYVWFVKTVVLNMEKVNAHLQSRVDASS